MSLRPAMARLLHPSARACTKRDPDPELPHAGGLLARFGTLCKDLGMTPTQAGELFASLPDGARRACMDDMRARLRTKSRAEALATKLGKRAATRPGAQPQ